MSRSFRDESRYGKARGLVNESEPAIDWQGLREAVARLEHERWAHWQRHVHAQSRPGPDGGLTIPAELVERWERQITTPYEALTSAEQESDREQADLFLALVRKFLAR